MATYEFNDKIKFLLPSDFILSRDTDDEGDEVVNILAGEYENDDGETSYKFNCRVGYTEYDPEEADEEITSENLLDTLAERMENSRRMKISEDPEAILLNKGIPLSIFGRVIKMFGMIALVRVDQWSVVQLIVSSRIDEDDDSVNDLPYENMLEVLKAIRIDGKKLSIANMNASTIRETIELTFDEDGEAIDMSPKLHFNIVNGDETTTYEYTPDGMKEVGTEKLRSIDPDVELYPHYNSIENNPMRFFPGAVINATGTEFEVYKFSTMLNTWSSDDADEERKPLLKKILDMNPAGYTLDETAKEMISLFHVDEDVFDSGHDREVELTQGYMRRAYMLSALRSFAWTLADYCSEHGVEPDEIDSDIPHRIANFVEYRNWLNYDGETYCKGLCAGSDLHVYFLPDAVTKTDRKNFLPTQEDIDRVKDMKKSFPNYNEIQSEVHSLEALRKDLEYIYPAVKILYDNLLEERDTSEHLEGADSDIVYAWIAMAMAAAEPFFTEDGPTNYDFEQPGAESRWEKEWAAREEERKEEAREQWMRKYEQYLETDPDIDFNGKLFVFSGLGGHWGGGEKDHPIVQKVIEKGGQYRSKVSGVTNYLVVDPTDAGASKMVAVLEQRQKGKYVKVVLLEDLENALEGKSASRKTTSASSTGKAEKKASTSSVSSSVSSSASKATKKVAKKDCTIDDENRLTSYDGSETNITLPQGIEIIGENAFMSSDIVSVVIPEGVEKIEDSGFWGCNNLKSVVLPSTLRVIEGDAFRMCPELESIIIPEGVYEIGADAFTSCSKLEDIYLPDSLWNIGDDAFCTFCSGMVLHVPKNSDAERYAKDNDIEYDNKRPVPSASPVAQRKTTASPKTQAKKNVVASDDYKIERGDILTGYNGSEKNIVIPDGIRVIGEDVFLSNDNILSVVIPEGVETIEDGAFWMCGNLRSVVLPNSLKKIDTNAFNNCDALTSIVIPDGCEEIGEDAFTSCKKLKDIYVPGSVYDIGNDAFCTFNDAMVIHTVRGSTAESFAKDHGWKVDYKQPTASTGVSKASTKTSYGDEISGVADSMSDLSAQIADMENQELSDEDRAALREVMKGMNQIGEQLAEGQESIGKYGEYLEQKEAREKAAEEEKARKKAEAMAAGKSEKDIVNMYVILTNEKKLGKLHRAQDKFYEIYEEDFPAMSKAEVIKTRKDMLAEMEDESLCSYYAESFKQRSVQERFEVSTRNLNNVSDEPDMGVKAEYAIANTQEWYLPAELAEVRRLMEADLAETRADLDNQLRPLDAAWLKFSTGKEFLQICISDKQADGSDLQDNFSCFQVVIGNQLVAVQIASKGIFRMSTTIMNCFPWYWGVTIRDIWEAALKNELYDSREDAYNGATLANQAIEQIRKKYPQQKCSTATSAPVTNAPVTNTQRPQNNTTVSSSAPKTQPAPAKKEGCYIATAVYGSYDAPEVLTLRRFRDNTLNKSVLGRWFIKTYYRLSPPVAEKLKDAKFINRFVRCILNWWVGKLNK